jgi:hypothetical protein
MIFKKIVLVAVFFIFIFSVTTASAQDSGWNALGLRAGIDDGRNVCEPASMTDAMMRI